MGSSTKVAGAVRVIRVGGLVLVILGIVAQAVLNPPLRGAMVRTDLPESLAPGAPPTPTSDMRNRGREADSTRGSLEARESLPPLLSWDGLASRGPRLGALLLFSFLWLVCSGAFGYATAKGSDWVVLLPLAVALVSRKWLTLHSLSENALHFYNGGWDKHSVVLSLFHMVIQGLGFDPFRSVLHVNGVLSALATLPVYLFVRQRSGMPMAALAAALLFAVDPIVTRFGPTDSPYSLLLATWFSGMALLSAPALAAAPLVAGASLLGIAATCRIEGVLYLVVSVLLVDREAIRVAVRRHPGAAALAAAVITGLIGLQMYYCLAANVTPQLVSGALPSLGGIVRSGVFNPFNEPLFSWLAIGGAIVGLFRSRHRFALAVTLAAAVAVLPMTQPGNLAIGVLHRFVPAAALQSIAAGVGVVALSSLLPAARARFAAPAIAAVIAFYTLHTHAGALAEPYFFNVEFSLLRQHVGTTQPAGSCTLLAVRPRREDGDVDLQNFAQLVPGITVLDCRVLDCASVAARGGCFRYLRSTSCFYLPDRSSREHCANRAFGPGLDKAACLIDPCHRLEQQLQLRPLAEHDVDLRREFFEGDRMEHFPTMARLGVYDVLGVRR